MSRREFHFISGASSKFWAIEMKGESFDVTFGKIGTAGTTQSKVFADAAASKKAYDKLVLEKTSKGYVEVGGDKSAGATSPTDSSRKDSPKGKSADASSTEPLNELYFSTTKDISDMGNLNSFLGKKVANFKSLKSIKKGDGTIYAIRVSYEDEEDEDGPADFMERLNSFLDSDAALKAIGLVLGNWSLDGPEPCSEIIQTLIAKKDHLPNLVGLFHGDIAQEENEISWIEQTDMTDVLNAFPKLELFRVRGGTGLSFVSAKHDKLRALGVETGGLSRVVVGQICQATFPELEYLELWLGDAGYGGDTAVSDLQPLFKGKLFPKLKYLGLRNSEITDEIAGVIVNSPIVRQLKSLDLSLGTLSDEGAQALMKLPQDARLKRLDLHRHFLSNAMLKQLKTLPFTLNVLGQEKPDDFGDGDRRFVAIGE